MSSIVNGSKGFVYALVSASLATVDAHGIPLPMIKVGATTLSPFERARQLTAATASPTPLFVAHYRPSEDVNADEARCHDLLDAYRVSDAREFFSAPLARVMAVIDEVTASTRVAAKAYPMAELFSSFPDDGSDRPLNAIERAQCRALEAELTAAGTLDAHRL